MKALILLFCLFPLISSFSQEIFISRDTMNIGNRNYKDSVIIYNKGLAVLKIDSVKCKNMNYGLNIDPNNDPKKWTLLETYLHNKIPIEIKPNDSLKIRLTIGMVLTKAANSTYNQIDTLYFYNNSANASKLSIRIRNTFIMGGVEDKNIPINYKLSQNYPNPFNPNTKILFSLNRSSIVVLKVYDNMGREIKELIHGYRSIGNYEVLFDGTELSSGVYYYQLNVGLNSTTRKMLLIK